MDDTGDTQKSSDTQKSFWQQFNDSQRQRLSAPQDKLMARVRAMNDLFGGSPDLAAGTVGATATPGLDLPEGVADPALTGDLQQELKNEQQQRGRTNAVKNLYGFGR